DRQGYALAVSGAFAMPDPAVYPAPTGLAVASNDSNGIALSFSGAAGAQSFQLYRAEGTCATASAGDFHMVANGAASPIVDNRTQGGFSYAYKLRGVQKEVERDARAGVDVISQDTCNLLPLFDTASVTADGNHSSCSVEVDWAVAQARWPAASGVRYDVMRETE